MSLATLGVTVDASGISAPTYSEILADIQDSYRAIYGSDIILDADTSDGQFLGILAAAINDANQAAIAAYHAYSPLSAQGVGLDSQVKINGIRRKSPSNSTAVLTITGVGGTVLTDCFATDDSGNRWDIPDGTTIGGGGTVAATGTCSEPGSITAGAGTITGIGTPTLGWQAVTNPSDAVIGAPVETDAALRRRQAMSVAIPAQAILDSLRAAVGNVEGVSRSTVYENDTDSTDGDGIPAHSISAVVEGGDVDAVAAAIFLRKPPGIQTYGTTDVTVHDTRGVPAEIHFYEVDQKDLKVEVTVQALSGWVVSTEALIRSAVAEFIAEMVIGEDSYLLSLAAPAHLAGEAAVVGTGLSQEALAPFAATFRVSSIKQAVGAGALAASDVTIAFNEVAICSSPSTRITFVVV